MESFIEESKPKKNTQSSEPQILNTKEQHTKTVKKQIKKQHRKATNSRQEPETTQTDKKKFTGIDKK